MIENEAINILKTESCCECPKVAIGYRGCGGCNIVEATWNIRKALKEIRQYRKIGTVEEFRNAMERHIGKPVKKLYGTSYVLGAGGCPVCGCGVQAKWGYCRCCGQKLDWEEDYEN